MFDHHCSVAADLVAEVPSNGEAIDISQLSEMAEAAYNVDGAPMFDHHCSKPSIKVSSPQVTMLEPEIEPDLQCCGASEGKACAIDELEAEMADVEPTGEPATDDESSERDRFSASKDRMMAPLVLKQVFEAPPAASAAATAAPAASHNK